MVKTYDKVSEVSFQPTYTTLEENIFEPRINESNQSVLNNASAKSTPRHMNETNKLTTYEKRIFNFKQDPKKFEEGKNDNKFICKICYVMDFDTVFLPCGHVMACFSCTNKMLNCPACRGKLNQIKHIYFP